MCMYEVKSLSCVRLFATPWTAAHQAPPWDSPGKSTGVGCDIYTYTYIHVLKVKVAQLCLTLCDPMTV